MCQRDKIPPQKHLHQLERWTTGEPHEAQQDQIRVLHLGRNNPHNQYQLGNVVIKSSPVEKDRSSDG